MNAYVICLVCLIVGGALGALSMLLLQIRDVCRLRNILKGYKEPVCKVVRDAVANREDKEYENAKAEIYRNLNC